jgi:putative ABC transport system substrate-binding protein
MTIQISFPGRLARAATPLTSALTLALLPLLAGASGIVERTFPAAPPLPVAAAAERVDISAPRLAMQQMTLAQLEERLRRPETQATLGKGEIAVLYPKADDPWRAAFLSIVQGIEERTRVHVRSYAVDARVDVYDLNAQLKHNGTRVVIALGRQGISTASALDRDIMVLAGGALLLSDSDNISGISLTPDPALLFARLKTLLPEVRRVLVVQDPRKSEWLIRIARDAARAQALELVTVEAHDLAQAARAYNTLFAAADARHDALWLPHDSTTVEEGTLMPLILRQSWTSGVPLFSSNLLHAKKGALFAMSPNNVELGHTLASSALGLINGEPRRKGVQPLRELHAALNLRTASHMGLAIDPQQQRTFDFIFPEP